jgi:hypothetical protein
MTDIDTSALDRELPSCIGRKNVDGSRVPGVEKPEQRRWRFYKVTAEGRRMLAQQRKTWAAFVEAVRSVTGDEHA